MKLRNLSPLCVHLTVTRSQTARSRLSEKVGWAGVNDGTHKLHEEGETYAT
jgi:hypothetical protein